MISLHKYLNKILIACISLMYSCEKDEYIDSNHVGPVGEISIEYIYSNGDFEGRIEHQYDMQFDRITEKLFYDRNNVSRAKEEYSYNESGEISSIYKRNPDNEIISFSNNTYTDGQISQQISLDSIYHHYNFTYENGLLIKITDNNDSQDYFENIEYFVNTGDIFRRWKYTPDSSLIEYTVNTEYSNGYLKKSTYNSSNEMIKWSVEQSSDVIRNIEHFDMSGDLLRTESWRFYEGKVIEHLITDANDIEIYKVEYLYFD